MIKTMFITFTFILIIIITINAGPKIKTGADVFVEKTYREYDGKKLGLITNATGMTSKLISTIDAIYELKGPKLIKLFGPEHGLRGDAYGGDKVVDNTDPKTGLPIFSLYGKHRKPTKEMMEDLDALLYDIQDIGNRTYTYIYTMAYGMQAAAENDIEFVVLDRPIAMYGNLVDGNILDPEFSSFIGLYPIPYIYGMTPGELATFFNKEFKINCKLRIVEMEGYNHEMEFEDTGLLWVPPSPHIPRCETSYYCAATGSLGELHTVCVGVGYTLPFELVGEEWVKGMELAEELNSRNLPGVYFRPLVFKPFYQNFKGKKCSGIQIIIKDIKEFLPFNTQIHILEALVKLHPESDFLNNKKHEKRLSMFFKATGTDQIRKALMEGQTAEAIIASYNNDLNKFKEKRKEYLLYD